MAVGVLVRWDEPGEPGAARQRRSSFVRVSEGCDAVDEILGRTPLAGTARHPLVGVRVAHRGRVVSGGQRLGRELRDGDVLEVRLAGLRGGGGDGGSTGAEDRKAWLEMFLEKKPDKVDPQEVKKAKWTRFVLALPFSLLPHSLTPTLTHSLTHSLSLFCSSPLLRCQISGERLSPPCVSDCLGNLYNKEAVLQRLLDKTMPAECSHVKGLRDLIELKLDKREYQHAAGEPVTKRVFEFDFQCPITGLEMNGRFRFYCVTTTGHVVSHRALKEVRECVEEHCGVGNLAEADLMPLNGTPEEVEALRQRAQASRKALKGKKKKKSKRRDEGERLGHGKTTATADQASKRFRAVDALPKGANKEVYASIFTSSSKDQSDSNKNETFLCRSLGTRN